MIKTIPIDLYNTFLILVVGDQHELKQGLEDHNKSEQEYEELAKDITPYSTGKTALLSGGDVVIWVRKSFDIKTIVHEIFHAVYFVMDKVGIMLTNCSDEAFAYLAGYIGEKVFDAINSEKGC